MRFASRLPLAASATNASATIPTDPKIRATPATERIIVQARPTSSSCWTSLKPTVVSEMTVM
jgi:hypothetical protein